MVTAEFEITDEVALITGGGGILGSRFAHALAHHGARVALVDREPAKAQIVAHEINAAYGARAQAYGADITDPDELRRVQQRIVADIGDVTVLINNAAAKSKNFFAPFDQFPLTDWDEVMRVNVTGVMLCCQVFGSAMAERGCGSIINIMSIYGVVAPDQRIYAGSSYEGRAINTPAVYSASKAAVGGLTKYLATYWGASGVRVNAISPGGVFSGQNDTFRERYSARVPMGRMAEPDEMSGALIFLASKASAYMTGQNLVVDGGLSVW
jgi:NAD(P)-dependent dehydrogenase (short-subunit alcohol dehydrogenase family)